MISIRSGNNLPETTHVIMGDYALKQFMFEVDNFNKTELKQYNAFINAIGDYAVVTITNIDFQMELNRVAPVEISPDIVEIDYSTLSAAEKKVIDAGLATLAAAVINIQQP